MKLIEMLIKLFSRFLSWIKTRKTSCCTYDGSDSDDGSDYDADYYMMLENLKGAKN